MVNWKDFQKKRYPRKKLTSYTGINFAVICGKISNNLLIIDLDYKENNKKLFLQIYDKFKEEFPELYSTTIVESPHGHHFYYYLDKPHLRKLYQDTKKDQLIKSLENSKNPTLFKKNNFPDILNGVDFLGAGYCIIPPSNYLGSGYKVIKDNPIKLITNKSLERIKSFFLRDKPEKSRMRKPFFDLINGKVELKELSKKTGKDEHVYWKSSYLEAHHNLGLTPEDIMPFFEKNQPHFDMEKTIQQLPHVDFNKLLPMTNKKMAEYFPKYTPLPEPKRKRDPTQPLYVSISKELKRKYNFITMEDTNEIYIKKGNIYSNKLGGFKKDMAIAIEESGKTITHVSANIMKYIKFTTQFDRRQFCYDSYLINFHNGYYNARENKFYPNTEFKDKLFCYEIPHDYNPDFKGKCPKFTKLLEEWLGDNNIVRPDDIFEMIGYSMTMNTDMKTAFFIYGPTHTGKTQFQTILEYVIGHQNRGAVPLQRLEKNEFGSDGLEFKILNMVGDMSDLSPRDTSTFKLLTGGDVWVGAEYKGGKKYEFRCILKIWYNGNGIPVLVKDDDAFYGRWVIVPFLHQFEMFDKTTIKDIGKNLCIDEAEIQGIIHQAIKGLKRLENRNYFRYEIIKNTKHTWRYEAEPLYAFIHDNCVINEDGGIICNEFKRAFNKFLYTRKLRPESSHTLKDKLEKFGIYKERHGPANDRDYYFTGLKWKPEDIDLEWEKKFFDK